MTPPIYKLTLARMIQKGLVEKLPDLDMYLWDFNKMLDTLIEVRDKVIDSRKDCPKCKSVRSYDILTETCVACGGKNVI